MSQEHSIQQQLQTAREQIQHLSQQLTTERDAVQQAHAQLQAQHLLMSADINERKQHETQINRQLATIEAAIDGIGITQDNTFIYINRAHLKMFGYTQAEELIGQPWTILYSPAEVARFEREVISILAHDGSWVGEVTAVRKDGTTFDQRLSLTLAEDGLVICVCEDISNRKQQSLALEAYAHEVEDLYNNAPCGYHSLDAESCITRINNTALQWLNYPSGMVLGQPITQFMTEASRMLFEERQSMPAQSGQGRNLEYEITLLASDGGQMQVLVSEQFEKDAEGRILGSRATVVDIRQRLKAEQILQRRLIQENLMRQVTARIRQSLDLATIFDTACNEVRQALLADRVAIFKFYPKANFNDGEFIAESMADDYPSVVSVPVHDHCFGENFANLYSQGRYYAAADIESNELKPCHGDILRQFQVRANLVVPLVEGENALWGLLCIHQCSSPRLWQTPEIDLVRQIADQLALAINQASLYQRIQTELEVRQRADAQISQQLQQQHTLAKITSAVRKSLAVDDILSTVTQQVKDLLQCDRVIIFRLYPDGRSRIVEESVSPGFANLKDQHWEDEVWSEDILKIYWQGLPRIVPDVMQDTWTNCLIDYSREGQIQSKIVAPILQEFCASEQHRWVAPWANHELWGIIVVHACREQRVWQEPEAELLQQVANSVAIALQQANLFEQLQQELGERQQAEDQLAERNQQLSLSNQELARATRLKDEFLANMSHELRTPLNAILGMAEAMQEEVFGPLTNRQRRSLTTIERSGNHLLSLINDILDVSKIESDQLDLDFTPVSISMLCNSSLTFVKQQAQKKNLQLKAQVPRGLPNLYGDERRLRQVLINLLVNAVKFTPEGGQITITAAYLFRSSETAANPCSCIHPQGQPADTVGVLTLAVTDTGIGISPENAKKLFQPFVQIDSALNRQHEGTGLGLVLVKRITEMHGGRVELISEVGSGSCFTIHLPVMANPSEDSPVVNPNPSLDGPAPATLEHTTAPLILLAEDNEASISTTTSYLTAKGYYLIVANNGTEVVNLANTSNPDLILMDIQMPRLDGLEAIRQIRQNPNLTNVPIVALTALAMPGDRERCLAAGANEYLSKPIRLKQLCQVIQTLLAE